MVLDTERSVTTPDGARLFAQEFASVVGSVEKVVLGARHAVRLVVACLFAGGHLLLEDMPGTGKTLLAKAMARSVQGDYHRIQFTPDLLPSDITGSMVYDPETRATTMRQGPVFTNLLLADEINRASPKTQSALLQSMEEGQVTVDGRDYSLPEPFMVIATQNPIEQAGTYPLPEAQLDRFLVRTKVGYPDPDSTVRLLADSALRDRSVLVGPVLTTAGVSQRMQLVAGVHVDPAILRYVSDIAEESRKSSRKVVLGVSVRGCLALVRLAKVWAAAQGRHYVKADDIVALAVPALAHRLVLDIEAEVRGMTGTAVIEAILSDVRPPLDRAQA